MPLDRQNQFALILHALLKIPRDASLGFTVEEAETELLLTGENRAPLDQLVALLSSAKKLRVSLPYTVTRTIDPRIKAESLSHALDVQRHISGSDLFELLFSASCRELIGKSWKVDCDNGAMMVATVHLKYAERVVVQIAEYSEILARATKEMILSAVATKKPRSLDVALEYDEEGACDGFLQMCDVASILSFERLGEDEKPMVYFRYDLLWQFLFSSISVPLMVQQIGRLYTLKINKKALLTFLSTTIHEGFIVAMSSAPSDKLNGVTVFFNDPGPITPQLHVTLVLDLSVSMLRAYNALTYLENFMAFIMYLCEISPLAIVHFIPFGNDHLLPFETNVRNTKEIAAFLKQINITDVVTSTSRTHSQSAVYEILYKTLEQCCSKNRSIQHMNRLCLLFTDGMDNTEDVGEEYYQKIVDYVRTIKAFKSILRYYTFHFCMDSDFPVGLLADMCSGECNETKLLRQLTTEVLQGEYINQRFMCNFFKNLIQVQVQFTATQPTVDSVDFSDADCLSFTAGRQCFELILNKSPDIDRRSIAKYLRPLPEMNAAADTDTERYLEAGLNLLSSLAP